MANQRSDRQRAAFIEQVQAVNNLITDKQASDLYNVRDAVQALLAFRLGERIIIDKSKRDTVL
jgi:hypothetical protein